MKNKILILLIFIVPIAIFALLEHSDGKDRVNATINNISDKGKLIKFYSPMCSECKDVAEHVNNVIKDFENDVEFEEIDVSNKNEETNKLIKSYKISVVPTVVFVTKNGKIVNKTEGIISEYNIRKYLEEITND